jgi:hypothetical protein
VDHPDHVVGEQGVGPSGDFAVVADVVGGVDAAHPGDRVTDRDALIERGEHPEAESVAQAGLADEDDRERGSGVHVVIGQQPDRFELMVVEQVGLVDDQYRVAAPFGVFGGQRLGGLGATYSFRCLQLQEESDLGTSHTFANTW